MLRMLPPPPRQMSVSQVLLRGVNLQSDSQSPLQQDKVRELGDEWTAAFADQLSERIDGAKMEQRPKEDLAAIAKPAIRQNIRSSKP